MSTKCIKELVVRVFAHRAVTWSAERAGSFLPSTLKNVLFKAAAKKHCVQDVILHEIEYMVYYGERNARSHFEIWDPVFSKLSGKHISVLRHAMPWWELKDRDSVYPINAMEQLDQLFARLPNLKAVFYPGNNGENLYAVRQNQYCHIFLGHGDSNKGSSANKMFRLYDEVWVAGQAHIERFDSVPGDYSSIKFEVIGQPWMAEWLDARPDYEMDELLDWAYLPTWRGSYRSWSYSSLSIADEIMNSGNLHAQKSGQGFIKPHPWTDGETMKAITQTASELVNVHIVDPTTQLRNCLEKPLRFVICDVSAALTECLYINVPIFLYRPPLQSEMTDDFEEQTDFCYKFQKIDELNQLLDEVILQGRDRLAEARAKAIAHTIDMKRTKSGEFYRKLAALPLHRRQF